MKRVYLSIVVLCVWAFSLHAQNGEFDPTNPGDPMPYYALTVNVSPSAGGTANITRTMAAEGQEVALRITPAKDFKLSQWVCGDSVLGTDTYLYYTMPARNVVITAQMVYEPEVFNPTSPDDPQGQGEEIRKHLVMVYTSPSVGGYTNQSAFYMQEGGQCNLYAYNNAGYEFAGWYIGDRLESPNNPVQLTMQENDITLTARFRFNPSSPEDPGANFFDPTTGELIIDRFTPGRLSDAVYSLVGNNESAVLSMTVIGKMNSSDLGATGFPNLEVLDLSRTTGYTEIPSWFMSYRNQLVRLLLPASIETIYSDAFYNCCSSLQEIVLYAPAPPTSSQSASELFAGIQEGTILRVPDASVSLYQASELWGNFVILPMDVQSLNVRIPDDQIARYENMFLELLDMQSGQVRRYVVTHRSSYAFIAVFEGSTYQLTMRNAKGKVFGQEMITFAGNDTTVTFSHLLQPVDLSLQVLDSLGTDISDNLIIDWYDNEGAFIQRGKVLTKQVENDILRYRIQLPPAFLSEYMEPEEQIVLVDTGARDITYQLQKHAMLTLSGSVLDSVYNSPVEHAKLTVKQTIKGQTQKLWTAETDINGLFVLQILDIPNAEITISASGYAEKTISLDQLQSNSTIYLKKIAGTSLTVQLQYTPVALNGTSSVPQDRYSDYTDFQFTIHNETRNKPVEFYQFGFPQLLINEEVFPSEELSVTVRSASHVFEPYETTVTVSNNNKADLPLALTERGGIQCSYRASASKDVTAILYDGSGKQVGYQMYSDQSVRWNHLKAGEYSLVSIKADDKIPGMVKLSDIEAVGLHAPNDYLLSGVSVSDGVIVSVALDSVPEYDELISYIGNNASFTANKSSLVVGDYLTLRGQLDFRQQFVNAISDVAIVVELPQSIEFIENAILVGGKIGSYTLNGTELTIPLGNFSDLAKFCVIPTNEGTYTINAYAQFTYLGEVIRQPLGLATVVVDNASIAAILKYSTNQVVASGLTTPNSSIELYDNDELIAIAKAKPNGLWQIVADIEEAYNLSRHQLYASITTPDRLKMRTKNKNLFYNSAADPDLKSVEMKIFENGHLQADITWDYINNVVSPQHYTGVTERQSYAFYADFGVQNRLIKKATLKLYLNEGTRLLPLQYKSDIDKWYGFVGTNMLNANHGDCVVNVSAEVYMESEDYMLDAGLMAALYNELRNPLTPPQSASATQPYDDLEDALMRDDDQAIDSILVALFGEKIMAVDTLDQEADTTDYESLIARANALADSIAALSAHNDTVPDWENLTLITDCSGLDSLALIQEGYVLIPKTNGRYVLLLSDENQISIVDFDENIHISIQTGSVLPASVRAFVAAMKQSRSCALPTKFKPIDDGLKNVNEQLKKITKTWEDLKDKLEEAADMSKALKNELARAIANIPASQKLMRTGLVRAMIVAGKSAAVFEQWTKNVALEFNDKFKDSPFGKTIGKLTTKINILTTLIDTYEFLSEEALLVHELNDLYQQVPTPECEPALTKADNLANEVCSAGTDIAWHTAEGLTYISAQMATLIVELAGAAESFGASLLLTVVNVGAEKIFEARKEANKAKDKATMAKYRRLVSLFKWKCEEDPNPEPEPEQDPDTDTDGLSPIVLDPVFPNLQVSIDPSGFVYEAVEENRVEGVKATVYYKDSHENIFGEIVEEDVMWNAEEFDQENPQYTDSEGKYQWFVPKGLWQVRFEKEGYEPTHSEWLPVPPPQLEVNIPIVQLRQPEVVKAMAGKDAIDITFDKYMMPSRLNTDNIFVTANDQTIAGTIVMLDEQHPYNDNAISYASRVRFVPAAPFTASEITLTVSTRVHSYADVPLAQTFQQTFDVEDATVIEPAQTPVASIASGTEVELGTQVTLSCATEGAVIRYTMDGSEPDCMTGYVYSAPIVLYGNRSVTVKAIACADGYDPSEVAQWTYSFPGAATAIEEAETGLLQVSKLLRDGQLLILRGDKTYTVTGQEVR